MRGIQVLWNNYRNKVVPSGAGPVQLEETKRAFFAGTLSLMDGIAELPEDQAIAMLGLAKEYLTGFFLGEIAKAQGRSDA